MNINRTLDIIAALSWVLLVVFTFYALIQNTRKQSFRYALSRLFTFHIRIFLVVAIGLTLLSSSLVFIEPQQVGVVISLLLPKGYSDQAQDSGLHFIVPLLERSERYPISWQTYTMAARPAEGQVLGDDAITARTRDGQEVSIDYSVIYRIDTDQVVRIHINWQNRYQDEFIRPRTRGLVRSLVAKYTVDEVNSTERANLEKELDTTLRSILADEGLDLGSFVLRNIAFSPEYAAAVEQKQVALQQIEQRKYEAEQMKILAAGRAGEIETVANAQATAVVVKGQAEADARLIQARSESESLDLVNRVLSQNQGLLLYQYIAKIAPGIKVMLLPSNSLFMLSLPNQELLNAPETSPDGESATTATPVATGAGPGSTATPGPATNGPTPTPTLASINGSSNGQRTP